MFSILPSETILHIIAFLPVHDICKLYLLSHNVNEFIVTHEAAVFHPLAVSQRFVSPGVSLDEAIKEGSGHMSGWLTETTSWRDLYRKRAILERNWSGSGLISAKRLKLSSSDTNTGSALYSAFQVLEDDRTILLRTTDHWRELLVYSLEDGQLRWTMHLGTRQFEWSKGFLLFYDLEGNIQVWKSLVLAKDIPPSPFPPAKSQHDQFDTLLSQFSSSEPSSSASNTDSDDARGRYAPHAFIPSILLKQFPTQSRFPRRTAFCYPVVVAINEHITLAHIFDIERGIALPAMNVSDLVKHSKQKYGKSGGGETDSLRNAVLLDLHVTGEWICICYDSLVLVVSHRWLMESHQAQDEHTQDLNLPPQPIIVLDRDIDIVPVPKKSLHELRQPSSTLDTNQVFKNTAGDGLLRKDTEPFSLWEVQGKDLMQVCQISPPNILEELEGGDAAARWGGDHGPHSTMFSSARISPDGQHLVAVTGFGVLYFISNFRRVLDGLVTLREVVQRIHVCEGPLDSIAWCEGYSARVLISVDSVTAVYLLNVDPTYHLSSSYSSTSSSLSLLKASAHRLLLSGSSLRMTRTGIYLLSSSLRNDDDDDDSQGYYTRDPDPWYLDFTIGTSSI